MNSSTLLSVAPDVRSLQLQVASLQAEVARLQAESERRCREPPALPARRLQQSRSRDSGSEQKQRQRLGKQQRYLRSSGRQRSEELGSEGGAGMSQGECTFERRVGINLNWLLTADGKDRCAMRHATLRSATKACAGLPQCVGVVRDNGMPCAGMMTGRQMLRFELRGGYATPQGGHVAWVCPAHYKEPEGRVAPHAKGAKAGFVFMLLGSCAAPEYACTHVHELKDAIASIRALKLQPERPIAILSDGGLPHDWVWEHLKPDIVQPLAVEGQQDPMLGEDVRGRKLLAYTQSPFEASVFLDGDTFVRSSSVQLLFDALRTFELAAAFECCRVEYGSPNTPYDSRGFFRGWEMQTGVMAMRKTPRVAQFWENTLRLYRERLGFWKMRSSAEQGAATLALAESDVRFLPLPPSFNARPFTMYHWLKGFGMPIYHGKELWKRQGLKGEKLAPERIIEQRMLRDWSTSAVDLVRQDFPR